MIYKASSPNDPLWKKTPFDYSPEEKVRYDAILAYAKKTGGMSFGDGNTIAISYDKDTLDHEEGHELDSIGPYFEPRMPAWKALSATWNGDEEAEISSFNQFLFLIFDKNGRRSFHTEMIQYLRETGRLSKGNPFELGSIYDPRTIYNLDHLVEVRYGFNPKLLARAKDLLNDAHKKFYSEVIDIHTVLAEIDTALKDDADFASDNKDIIISYLATRGSEDWNPNELRQLLPEKTDKK